MYIIVGLFYFHNRKIVRGEISTTLAFSFGLNEFYF